MAKKYYDKHGNELIVKRPLNKQWQTTVILILAILLFSSTVLIFNTATENIEQDKLIEELTIKNQNLEQKLQEEDSQSVQNTNSDSPKKDVISDEDSEFNEEDEITDPFTPAAHKSFNDVQEVETYVFSEESDFSRVNLRVKIKDNFTNEKILSSFNEEVFDFIQSIYFESFESVFINGMFETTRGDELPLVKVEVLKTDLVNIDSPEDIKNEANEYIVDKKF